MESNYTNYTYCAILIYIVVMISFVVLKPHFIYNHSKKQYKEFGNTGDKTLLSLPVLAVIVAIFMGIIFCSIGRTLNNPTRDIYPLTQHPINYYPLHPQQLHPQQLHPQQLMYSFGQPYFKPNLVQ